MNTDDLTIMTVKPGDCGSIILKRGSCNDVSLSQLIACRLVLAAAKNPIVD